MLFRSNNISYKPPTQVGLPQVEWAEFKISAEGHKVALSRTEGIAEWPVPQTRQGLMKLTGWVQWAAQGVRHIAALLHPFYAAINDPHPPDLSGAMVKLKEALSKEEEWLAHPRLGEPFTIYTDASGVAIGASIFQADKPVAHLSHALTRCQRAWPVRDREMWAVIWTLQHCPWLRGSPLRWW